MIGTDCVLGIKIAGGGELCESYKSVALRELFQIRKTK